MSTITISRTPDETEDPPTAIVSCLCGLPHPCTLHGAWARAVAEQLHLEVDDR